MSRPSVDLRPELLQTIGAWRQGTQAGADADGMSRRAPAADVSPRVGGCGCVCDLKMEGFHSFNIFIAIDTCFIKHGIV